MSVRKIDVEEFYGTRNAISWEINMKCNFQCHYCTQWRNNNQILKPIDTKILAESLDYLKGKWQINITGGEPFLEKNFIDICLEITRKHSLGLLTNLSTANVFDFADQIKPDKCQFINAAVHITEREKRDPKLKYFIEKMIYLQKKGFNITAFYVAHPALFDRIKFDIEFLKSSGIKHVRMKVFFGTLDNKYYPDSYTSGQKEFLEGMETDYPELEVLNRSHNYYGKLCLTGQKFFTMDRNGNLRRCSSVLKNYGNLFEKSIRFDVKTNPCPKTKCTCPFEGIVNSRTENGNMFSILKGGFIDRSIALKNRGNNKAADIRKKAGQLYGVLDKAGLPFYNTIKKIFKN